MTSLRVLKIKPHLTEDELRTVMNRQKYLRDFKDWQIIHSVQVNPGETADKSKIKSMTGFKWIINAIENNI